MPRGARRVLKTQRFSPAGHLQIQAMRCTNSQTQQLSFSDMEHFFENSESHFPLQKCGTFQKHTFQKKFRDAMKSFVQMSSIVANSCDTILIPDKCDMLYDQNLYSRHTEFTMSTGFWNLQVQSC